MNGTKLTGKIGHIKKEMKMLLYCTKSKPRLFFDKLKQIFSLGKIKSNNDLNGKIVAECDFEVEEIFEDNLEDARDGYVEHFYTLKSYDDFDEGQKVLLKESCLQKHELSNYLGFENGYAIHIKNLKIFDEPRELEQLETCDYKTIKKAPQNMMKCMVLRNDERYDEYVLISIRPEWLCKILNKEKTIEIRKKVLREMIK